VLALIVGAMVYLYPELTTVYAPIYAAALLVMLWASGWDFARLVPSLVAAGLALLLVLAFVQGTLGFLGGQLQMIASERQLSADWYKYFHAFVLGGGGSPFNQLGARPGTGLAAYAEAAANLIGLFRIIPRVNAPAPLHNIAAAVAIVLLPTLLWFALRALERRQLWLPATLVAGAVVVVGLDSTGNLYGAGKAFFWLSPFLLILLLLPLARPRARHWQRLPAYAYALLQAISLLVRLESVAANDGIPGTVPYPGDVEPARKASIELNLSRLMDRLDSCRLVRVDLADSFLRHYVMVNLFVRDIPYFSVQPINSYYGAGRNLGLQTPHEAPDCTVRLGAPGTGSKGRSALVLEPPSR